MLIFKTDIAPMFSVAEQACMKAAPIPPESGEPFDLHNHADVALRAERILLEVAAGAMPKGGVPWDINYVRKFAHWIDGGKLP